MWLDHEKDAENERPNRMQTKTIVRRKGCAC